jgi:hypothetical protein
MRSGWRGQVEMGDGSCFLMKYGRKLHKNKEKVQKKGRKIIKFK